MSTISNIPLSLSLVMSAAVATVCAQGVRVEQTASGRTETQLGDRCDLVIAARLAPPLTIPGIAGPLAVDPTTMVIVPGRRSLDTDLAQKLARMPGQRLAYQRLEHRAEGIQLSPALVVDLQQGPRQVDDEAVCRARAARFVQSIAGNGMAPEWTAPRLAAAQPVYRPDVAGVAYYEFAVEPSGYVVAATGEHDRPIAQWDHAGVAPSAQLARAAGTATVARVFKLDTLSYVGEDTTGNMVGQINSMPPRLVPADAGRAWQTGAWQSWQELKAGYRTTYLSLLENLRMDSAISWVAERMPPVGPLEDWSAWSYWYAGNTYEQRNYYQWTENGCAVGCGPVAWAMLIGWVDNRAQFDPRWYGHWGIYRYLGGYGGNAVAPSYVDSGIVNIIREIRYYVGTFCSFGSGATLPTSMINVWQYGSYRAPMGVRTNANIAGTPIWYCNDALEYSIKALGTPAIMGTGFLSHYPLGHIFAQRQRQVWWWTEYQKMVYVNQGWGGSGNTWVDAGTWFAGEIL